MFNKIANTIFLAFLSPAVLAAPVYDFHVGADAGRIRVSGFGERDTSFGVFAGYRFHEHFAVEAGFRRLADFDDRFLTFRSQVRADQLALSMTGTLPLGERFGVYARLGVNQLDVKGSSGGFGARDDEITTMYGIGLRATVAQGVFARLEVQKPAREATLVNVGLGFQF